MRLKKDKKYCVGCHDNFYNGNNPMGVKECWGFGTAKVVKRLAIGWWVPMDRKENFYEVTIHDCRKEPGGRAFLEKLPRYLA